MGANQWRREKTWPPADATLVKYYLSSNGRANSADGDGALSLTSPLDEPPDRFDYDPGDPVTTDGEGKCCSENIPAGPRDQRQIERRKYEFVIDLGHTSNVFLKGHRIRLEISSSNFPRYSRNTNTGDIPEKDTSFTIARQTIHHNRQRQSHLVLPLRAKG